MVWRIERFKESPLPTSASLMLVKERVGGLGSGEACRNVGRVEGTLWRDGCYGTQMRRAYDIATYKGLSDIVERPGKTSFCWIAVCGHQARREC